MLSPTVLSGSRSIKSSMERSTVGTGEMLSLLARHCRLQKGGGIGSEGLQDRGQERLGPKGAWEPTRVRASGHHCGKHEKPLEWPGH